MASDQVQCCIRRDKPPLDFALGASINHSLIVQVYTFRNIRYAAPPVGNLRWAKPAAPEPVGPLLSS